MKKILMIFVVVLTTLSAVAQIDRGFRHGIKANIGVSNVTECGAKMKLAYGLGWVAEYNFNENLFVNTGVNFQCIGMRDYENGYVSGTLNALYAQIPLFIGGRVSLDGRDNYFFCKTGPIFGVGMAGSQIYWYALDKTTNYFDDAHLFNLAIAARVGLEFHKIQISTGFDYGMINTFKGGGHNINVLFSLGYMF